MNDNESIEVYQRSETVSPDFSTPSPVGSPTIASEMSDP